MLIGIYSAKYVGRTMCGFVNEYEYIIQIGKDTYGYTISGISNITENKAVNDACINYASEKSIRRNWIIKEDIIKLGE